jgi:dihydroflavonol-4-reductase
MKTLVTGATGFIGGHIARAGLEAGWEVRALRRDPARCGHLAGLPISWVRGDLNDPASLRAAMQGIEIVFHAAAFYPKDGNPRKVQQMIAASMQEIQNVLTACREAGIRRLVYTSTLTTIGQPPPGEARLADERDFYQPGTLPKSAYYETKIAMEQAVLQAAAANLDAVIVNPTAVFGPGDVHLTLGGLLIAAARGWMIGWLPGAINVVDGRDVAAAQIVAAQSGGRGERYILGGHNFTVRQALEIAAAAAGARPPRFEIPLWAVNGLVLLSDLFPFLGLPANHMRTVAHWQGYNTEKARRALGLTPRPFEETVRDALAWFEARNVL